MPWIAPGRDRSNGTRAPPSPAGGSPRSPRLASLAAAPLLEPERSRRPGKVPPIGALKTINTSQTLFRESDRDGNGALDFAASSLELGRAALIDDDLSGGVLAEGFVVRVVRDPAAPGWLWSAAVDPLDPRGDRYFFINQAGVIFYTGVRGSPVVLDPSNDAPPPGWLPVGK